jgi:hypothetical protein
MGKGQRELVWWDSDFEFFNFDSLYIFFLKLWSGGFRVLEGTTAGRGETMRL